MGFFDILGKMRINLRGGGGFLLMKKKHFLKNRMIISFCFLECFLEFLL